MPKIEVIDPTHVTIDGTAAGSVCDVIENHKDIEGIRSLVLDALVAWDAARVKAHRDALDAKDAEHAANIIARHKMHDEAVAAKDAEHSAGIRRMQEKHDRRLEDFRAALVQHQSHVDALGGTELGRKLADEAKRKALADTIARAQVEMATLAEPTPAR